MVAVPCKAYAARQTGYRARTLKQRGSYRPPDRQTEPGNRERLPTTDPPDLRREVGAGYERRELSGLRRRRRSGAALRSSQESFAQAGLGGPYNSRSRGAASGGAYQAVANVLHCRRGFGLTTL